MSKQVEGHIKTLDMDLQQFKVASSQERIIEGFFTTTDLDREGDISLPAAFEKTMQIYMKNPVLTYMHDIRKIMGKVLEYTIQDAGVWVRAQIAKGVDWIDKDVWPLIEQGMLKGFSYGYSVVDSEKSTKDGKPIRLLKEVDVYEVAIVSVPMNASALFTLSSGGLKAVSVKMEKLETPEEEEETVNLKDVEQLIQNHDTEIKTYIKEEIEKKGGCCVEKALTVNDISQLLDEKLAVLKKEAAVEVPPEPVPAVNVEQEKEIVTVLTEVSNTIRELVASLQKGG